MTKTNSRATEKNRRIAQLVLDNSDMGREKRIQREIELGYFIRSIDDVNFFSNDGAIKPEWLMFEDYTAALSAFKSATWRDEWGALENFAYHVSRKQAGVVSRESERIMARDKAFEIVCDILVPILFSTDTERWPMAYKASIRWTTAATAGAIASCIIVADQPDIAESLNYMYRRWEVITAGYGLLGVVGDSFYVYQKPQ